MAQVSGIEIAISANPAGLERGLNRAENALSRFSKSAIAGLAGALSAGAFVAAGKAALNYADNIGKVAQKIGMTTEELSGLNYAAKLSDVSLEQLQSTIGIMARKMGESADSFRTFGVELKNTDGSMRGTNEVLMDIADKFSKMPDGVQKSQWALELFGRSGLDLIPLLNGGSQAIAEATNQARLFGVIVSQEAAAGAEQFNDNITKLQNYVSGAVQNFTTGLTPALVNVSSALVDSATSTDVFRVAGETAGRILEGIARIVIVVKDNLYKLNNFMATVGLVLFARNVLATGVAFVQFAKAIKASGIVLAGFNLVSSASVLKFVAISVAIAYATDNIQNLNESIKHVVDISKQLVPELGAIGQQIASAFDIDLSGFQTEFDNARKTINGLTDESFVPPPPPGAGAEGDAKQRSAVPGVARSQEVDAFYIARLESIRNGFKSEREILEEEYAADMELLRGHLTGKDELDAEFKELMRKRAEQHARDLNEIERIRIENALSNISTGLGSMAAAFQSGGKKMLRISKIFAAAQAIVDTIKAAVQAMTNPMLVDPASKFAAYAAVFAKGMSAVAAIKGVSESGGGGGGSGGGGSTSSSASTSSSGGGGGAAPTTTFSFTMMNDPMGFGEKFARQFIDQLNSTQRNGGTIRGVIA